MSGMMMHGLGDRTPELNCGCMAESPRDVLRERIARALWDRSHLGSEPIWAWEYAPPPSRESLLDYADAVIAALVLREKVDWEGHYWQTPWERIEEDA